MRLGLTKQANSRIGCNFSKTFTILRVTCFLNLVKISNWFSSKLGKYEFLKEMREFDRLHWGWYLPSCQKSVFQAISGETFRIFRLKCLLNIVGILSCYRFSFGRYQLLQETVQLKTKIFPFGACGHPTAKNQFLRWFFLNLQSR